MTDTSTNPPEAPSLAKNVSDWLDGLAGLPAKSDAVAERVASHDAGQKMIADRLDLDKLKGDMTFELTKVPDGMWENFKASIGRMDKLQSMDADGDAMKEIDTWHDLPGTEALDPEALEKLTMSFKEILKLRDDLEKNPAYQRFDEATQKNVPDDQKIANDLWYPLVREGVIPENMVPSRYSEVENTFGAASEAYEARLTSYSADLSTPQKYLDKLKPGFSVAEGLMKATIGGLGVAANAEAVQVGAESATDVAKGRELQAVSRDMQVALLCVTSTRTAAEKIIEEKDVYGAADAFNAILKSILTATVGKESANLISTMITCGTRGVSMAEHLAKGDVAGALDDIAKGVESAMVQNNSDNKTTAGYIRAGIEGMAAVAKGVQSKDPREGIAKAIGAASTAAKTCGSQIMTNQRDVAIEKIKADTSLTETERDERSKAYKAAASTSPDGTSEMSKGAKEAILMDLGKMISKSIDKDAVKEQEEAFQKEQEQAMLDFRNEPDPAFEELLVNGFSDVETDLPEGEDEDGEAELRAMEKQANQIETLIAIRKKDQMTFDLAKNIVTGGTGFVASLLPAAGIISVGSQLMFAMLEAVKHSEQLAIWTATMNDAKKSGSVQAEAILNRFNLANEQAIKADIIAALKAVDLIGQIVKTAGGPAAPVGLAISGATKVAEGAMDVALTIKTEIQMYKAWQVYKRALDTPQDRKLAREALRQNPTLSKYAIAYGACKEKNPIAIKAMARCGLNAKTLADPGTNVNKVVTYLETVYADDPILLKAQLGPEEWHPGKPVLQVLSWQSFYLSATTSSKIKPKVTKADVSRITAGLSDFEKKYQVLSPMIGGSYDANGAEEIADKTAAFATVSAELISALNAYKPTQDGTSDRHEGMTAYLSSMVGLVGVAQKEVEDLVAEIAAAKEIVDAATAQAALDAEIALQRAGVDEDDVEV